MQILGEKIWGGVGRLGGLRCKLPLHLYPLVPLKRNYVSIKVSLPNVLLNVVTIDFRVFSKIYVSGKEINSLWAYFSFSAFCLSAINTSFHNIIPLF